MSVDNPGASHRARVRDMIDSVELIHPEVQLADICRINEAALTVEERIQWAGWQRVRDGELRGRVRLQAACVVLSAVAGALAWLRAMHGDPSGGVQLIRALLLAAGIALCGAALLIEIQMADHAGYQPWPVRFRLGRKARERVNLQLLRNSLDDELTCGHRADEARLVIVAKTIARAITRSAPWRSDFLDRHNLRCDVELDLVGIARGAVDLWNQRREMARSSTDLLQSAAAAVDTDRWNALLTRLAWLHRYLTQLQMLAAGTTEAGQSTNPDTTTSTEPITTEIRFTIMALASLTPDTGRIR